MTALCAQAGEAAAEEAEFIADVHGSARLQEASSCASMSGARVARRRWTETRDDGRPTTRPKRWQRQVGRSVPRLEGRAKVTGRAEYVHNLRLPGMLLRQDLPQHRRARPHQAHRHQRRAARSKACYRVVTVDDVRKVIPDPYYGPAFHDQPILALDKVRYVGEPVAVVLADRSACRGGGRAARSSPNTRSCRPSTTRSRR